MSRALVIAFMAFTAFRAQALTLEESELVVRESVRTLHPLVLEARPDFRGEIPVRLKWEDDYPSASSGEDGITLTGGLLRLPYLTSDAIALILCHEVGHDKTVTQAHVGSDKVFSGEEIMADYFAGTCLPRVLQSSVVLAGFPGHGDSFPLSPRMAQKCLATFPDPTLAAICVRQAKASMVFMQFLYRELFRQAYEASGLAAPSFDRAWAGDKDFLQCRLLNLERGIFHASPVACQDEG